MSRIVLKDIIIAVQEKKIYFLKKERNNPDDCEYGNVYLDGYLQGFEAAERILKSFLDKPEE